jgi:hypothetical protein
MSIYFGGIGKDYSWNLASETPIVIYDPKKSEFFALKSLEELKPYEGTDCEAYIWSERTGNWEDAGFVVLTDKPSPVGFSVQQKAKNADLMQ